jgi:hypothetical protein
MIRVVFFAAWLVLCVACAHRQLRGSATPSQDGHTYLAVMDDNGGKVWPFPSGQAGRVEPGSHTIECGGSIQFDIPKGVLFQFDYLGP